MSEPTVLGVVPARGGSKGVPYKNIRLLGGKPLIAYTIEAARKCRLITEVVVSTDDPRIQEAGLQCGASAPFLRPAELATDRALAVPTIQHAVTEMEALRSIHYDYVVMLQPTTPLRSAEDLDIALGDLIESGADGVISVVHVDNWHPMKMKKFVEGRLIDYEKPPVENPPRQSLPPVYMVNGALYGTRRDVLMMRGSFQGDHCLGYIMPNERSVNIDSEVDFVVAEYMLNRLSGSAGGAHEGKTA